MRVSSGTRPKIPRNICAFLQERAQKLREPLARLFRNAPKNPQDTRAFLQERAQKSASHSHVSSGTRPKKSPRHSRVSSGTRPKNLETLARFFRKALKNPRDTRAFLQERAQKIHETLARFFRNAPKKSTRQSHVSSGTRPKIP